jgi:hypothetical protein
MTGKVQCKFSLFYLAFTDNYYSFIWGGGYRFGIVSKFTIFFWCEPWKFKKLQIFIYLNPFLFKSVQAFMLRNYGHSFIPRWSGVRNAPWPSLPGIQEFWLPWTQEPGTYSLQFSQEGITSMCIVCFTEQVVLVPIKKPQDLEYPGVFIPQGLCIFPSFKGWDWWFKWWDFY